ncbi:MAG: glycerol-3-phosphate 1-O-acyltransferase PlsY [Gammaproteobacteria bacterium]
MIEWLFVPAAYLLGSISSAVLVCRIMGLPDPRGEGSGNPGATNVLRIGGKKAAAITLTGDLLKGLFPVLLAKAFGVSEAVLLSVALAAFLGHLYPLFFDFRGGKGVATGFGVLLGISLPVGLLVFATWLLVYKLFKISSLSALSAAVLSPIYIWVVIDNFNMLIVALIMSGLLLWRHESNIRRLLAGQER